MYVMFINDALVINDILNLLEFNTSFYRNNFMLLNQKKQTFLSRRQNMGN